MQFPANKNLVDTKMDTEERLNTFPAVSVRAALVVFHLAFHDSFNVNANFRKVVENADDAINHLDGNSLRLF